jgi:cytochrome c oxidase cbb3-type subunit 3
VISLNSRPADAQAVTRGKAVYTTNCALCHGADGKGKQELGAPNLTNNIWLYGGSPTQIKHSIQYGRNGQMPAQKDFLSKDQIHLVAAYVYSLSHSEQLTSQTALAE